MSEASHTLLRSYASMLSSFQRTTVSANYSRSKDVVYSSISKQDDVARFNSSINRVTFYKSYPNRGDTPIKAAKTARGQTTRACGQRKERIVKEIFRKYDNGFSTNRNGLYLKHKQGERPTEISFPKIRTFLPADAKFVMNDFHIKETNPGFARNNLGGFFTK